MKTTYYTYELIGIPITVMSSQPTQRTKRESQKMKIFNAKRQFELQHGNRPLLVGNLTLIVKFYFPPQIKLSNKENIPFPHKPTYLRLLDFINRTARGIVFQNSASVTKIELEKLYSLRPRTEIILIEERKT
jgi:hypothetical protein